MTDKPLDLDAIEARLKQTGKRGPEAWALILSLAGDVPALVARVRELEAAIDSLGAVYADPMNAADAASQVVRHIKELEAGVWELEANIDEQVAVLQEFVQAAKKDEWKIRKLEAALRVYRD